MIAGEGTIRASEGTIRAGQIFHWYLILWIWIQKCYQNEIKFNCVYNEFKSIGTLWAISYVSGNNRSASYDEIYFGSFGFENI